LPRRLNNTGRAPFARSSAMIAVKAISISNHNIAISISPHKRWGRGQPKQVVPNYHPPYIAT
jgi:hypothetical protein